MQYDVRTFARAVGCTRVYTCNVYDTRAFARAMCTMHGCLHVQYDVRAFTRAMCKIHARLHVHRFRCVRCTRFTTHNVANLYNKECVIYFLTSLYVKTGRTIFGTEPRNDRHHASLQGGMNENNLSYL